MYDARAVANFFIDHAAARGHRMPLMTILKLIYFSHGWYLARQGTPLIKNDFEAWERGPVVKVVYDSFKEDFKNAKPVNRKAEKFDPVTGEYSEVIYNFDRTLQLFLTSIYQRYGHIHALELSKITHEPGSPWDEIWNAPPGKVTLGMRISNERIRAYFARNLSLAAVH
jgi:uncharacterized phage-associated protein